MKRNSLLLSLFISFLLLGNIFVTAQISREGMPPSFSTVDITHDFQQVAFSPLGMDVINQADDNLANSPGPYRIGHTMPVNLSIEDAGTWTDLPSGGRIWRLTLSSEDAIALSLYYDDFWLPVGGELYLYNEMKTQVIGAFTDLNNDKSGQFSTEIIEGESVTLEYYEPDGVTENPIIHISDMAYLFRGVSFTLMEEPEDRGGSLWCMINVNCPEGDNWQMDKKGVVRQYMILPAGWIGWCTGSMINNTTWDLTPYVLTAHHCGEDCLASHFNQWIFYFKFESATCTGSTGPQNFTVTGCSLKAEGDRYTGSDFALLLLNSTPPASHEPYWGGWNRTDTPSPSGVGIHHPAGDIKKISTYSTTLGHSQWNNNGVLSHWKAVWAPTVNGTSIVEEGSSGSPLYDNEHRIVGDLTGGPGNMSCENTSYSLYGKIYWSWDKMGNQSHQQLKYWLDPINTGDQYLPGTDGNDPICDFEADDPSVAIGGNVDFFDLSLGNPENWSWSFPGGNPTSSTDQNPENIVYNNYGSYSVTLTISNAFGSDTETKTGYISVGDPPEADFNANNTEIGVGQTVTFTDATTGNPTGWHWQLEGGTPSVSFNQNPAPIHYYEAGVFQVKLIATNDFGTDTEIKDDFITVYGPPTADFEADTTLIPVDYAVNFTDISYGNPSEWEWLFEGGDPETSTEQNPQGIVYDTPGSYSVTLAATSQYGSHDTLKLDFITVLGPPEADFTCFDRYILVGESASLVDQSTGSPESWDWVFEGGNPETSNLQFPDPVQYNSAGEFDVTLTVETPFGENTLTKPDYINVGYVPEADFEADNVFIVEGESVNFTDLSTEDPVSWSWVFEGGTPETSSEQSPQNIVYNQNGAFDVTLSVVNNFGQDTKTEVDYIYVSGVGVDEQNITSDNVFVFPNPTNGMINMVIAGDISTINRIDVFNALGNSVLTMGPEKSFEKKMQFDLSGHNPGLYYINIETKEGVILKKITLTK